MLEIKFETIANLTPAIVLLFLVFMFFFIKRNSLSLTSIIEGIKSFIFLLGITIFLVVGYVITNLLIKQRSYIGLIIPFGWFFIYYQGIKRILFATFGVSVKKLIDFNSLIGLTPKFVDNIVKIIFLTLMSSGFLFFTVMIFFVAVPDTANQPYGMFPLIIAGLIFLIATVILFYVFYKVITKIIFHRVGLVTKNKTTIVKKDTEIGIIFLRVWFLFIVMFAYLAIVGKSNG